MIGLSDQILMQKVQKGFPFHFHIGLHMHRIGKFHKIHRNMFEFPAQFEQIYIFHESGQIFIRDV